MTPRGRFLPMAISDAAMRDVDADAVRETLDALAGDLAHELRDAEVDWEYIRRQEAANDD
jgi:DNA-binding transcriptional regulator YdaS (Cro superfamily)